MSADAPGRCQRLAILTVCLILMIGAFPAPIASAGEPENPTVSTTPDGPGTAELELRVKAGAEKGRLDFFVRQAGPAALDDVSIVATAGDLAVAITNATGGTDVTVPPAGGAALLHADVTGLTEPRDVRVPVYLTEADGTTHPLTTLRIVRADAQALTVVGAAGGGLTFDQDREAFSRDVLLRSDSATPVESVLTVTPLQDGTSAQVPLELSIDGAPIGNGSAVTLGARQRRTLTLRATLARAGSYTATMSFAYGTDRASGLDTTITITRTAGAQTVVVEPAEAVRAVRHPCLEFWHCPARAVFTVTFRETAGERGRLDPVQVREVVFDDNGTTLQSTYDEPVLRLAGKDEPVTALETGPRGTAVVTTSLGGLRQAGKYEVRLRGTSPGTAPVDATVKVLVRNSWLQAAMFILLGTLVSWVLRWWLKGGRRRIAVRAGAEALDKQLQRVLDARGDLPDARRPVVDRVRSMIGNLRNRADGPGDPADLEAAVTDLRTRLRLLDQWLDVALTADRSGSAAAAEKLDAAKAVILQPARLDTAAEDQAATHLNDARDLLDAGVARHRAEQVDALLARNQPPLGYQAQAWAAWQNATKRRLATAGTGSPRQMVIDDIYAEALQDMARQVRDKAVSLANAAPTQEEKDKLKGLADRAGPIIEMAAAFRLRAAHQAYDDLVADYLNLVPTPAGQKMSAQQTGVEPITLTSTPDPATFAAATQVHSNNRRWLTAGDGLAFAVLTAIAVTLGLVALYLNNPIWGTPMDQITAFLWGMGLYQVGGAASDGIEGLRKKIAEA